MKLVNNLLDYNTPWSLPDVYLFTGNAMVRNDGAVVMGRGAAKQVRDTYPHVQYALGKKLFKNPITNLVFVQTGSQHTQLSLLPSQTNQWIGWFKVKYHWAEPADLDLIYESTSCLTGIATKRPDITFHMNYPGVGNGRLTDADVAPLLSVLPDNVIIYR